MSCITPKAVWALKIIDGIAFVSVKLIEFFVIIAQPYKDT